MQSLRDKLLKAGLVTEDQARKSTETKRAPAARPAPSPAAMSVPKLPPMPGSREYQRLESAKQQQLTQELRARVVASQVALEPGEHTFHFVTRKGKLRRLDLSPSQAARLENGELAVVERHDPAQIEHALVPASVAEELLGLSEKVVRFLARPGNPVGFTPVSDEPDAQT